ncbi:MAG: chaperone protein HtpG [Planctomycetota bacterium]|nr:MAG: chaperone protein HtpG [Planctomycetota bacterium]
MTTAAAETFAFQAEVNQILSIVVNSLYSHKEIFLRELISNASDALDKLRARALLERELYEGDETLEIRIVPDPEAGTLTIEDTGIGMSREELIQNLGTIAHSGTRAFLEQLAAERQQAAAGAGELRLIGQFGVGFYSAFLVADRVEVTSRPAGAGQAAHRWSSDARGSFTVEPAERSSRGTAVTLHLKPEERRFLEGWRLRELIERYSDYVGYEIKLWCEPEGKDKGGERRFEVVNRGVPVWHKPKEEITKEQYEELYRHLTHDWEPPLAWTHFVAEGTVQFTGVLFIPKRPPFDLFLPEQRAGLRLYVRRVFIMEDCEELLPRWLRFVRGVIDSDDLPLNVSRELLQDSAVVRTIRRNVVRKTLELLEELAQERPQDYAALWRCYGAVLKEGVHLEPEQRERLAKLLRFDSSREEGLVALADYVARMPADQKAIYYAIGESRAAVAASPHTEALRARGWEVLYLTDPIDEFLVHALPRYQDKPLVSAMKAELELEPAAEQKERLEAKRDELKGLLLRMRAVLGERVRDVRLSSRLTTSPCCLVVPEGGLHAHMERLLRAHGREVPETRRILEVNPEHPLIGYLQRLYEREPTSERLAEWIELLYDQALLGEGSPVSDPARFARRVTALLEQAAASALGEQPAAAASSEPASAAPPPPGAPGE